VKKTTWCLIRFVKSTALRQPGPVPLVANPPLPLAATLCTLSPSLRAHASVQVSAPNPQHRACLLLHLNACLPVCLPASSLLSSPRRSALECQNSAQKSFFPEVHTPALDPPVLRPLFDELFHLKHETHREKQQTKVTLLTPFVFSARTGFCVLCFSDVHFFLSKAKGLPQLQRGRKYGSILQLRRG